MEFYFNFNLKNQKYEEITVFIAKAIILFSTCVETLGYLVISWLQVI